MNTTQAGIWHLCDKDAPPLPDDPAYTDITDAWALFGLVGESIPEVLEQITEIDLGPPAGPNLMFIQGPVFNVSARIVVIKRNKDTAFAMIALPRGYGQSVADALLDTGSVIGLHPAGMNLFFTSLNQIIE
jgi:sarcosine oxidase subunit alpha